MWLLLALLAHDKSGEAIVRRNIFCSDCRPVVHRTVKPARLLGTLTGGATLAFVRLETQYAVFEIGSRLGEVSVASIEERRVVFDDGDVLEFDTQTGSRLQAPGSRQSQIQAPRAYLEHPEELAGTINVVPDKDGVRVISLRSGSPLAQLGLQRGDVIRAVNGCELTGLDASLACYQRLRNVRYVSVALIRAGKPVTLDLALDRE
jgi:C-terminal processing protease CtpA/Prc